MVCLKDNVVSSVSGLSRVFFSILCIIYTLLESLVINIIPRRWRLKDISSDTVLITGSGNGIGRELAMKFSELAAKVVLLDIKANDLEDTAKIISGNNASRSNIHTYLCDVSQATEVYATAAKIRSEVGPVTILVNNAGIVEGKNLLNLADDEIQKTVAVNALAHFWTVKAFLPDMIAAKRGHIVSIASLAGYFGLPNLTDYCASKAAAVGFLEALKYELANDGNTGIKLTLVAPYHINTQLFKGFKALIGSFSPEWAAEEIIRAIRCDQEFLTVPHFLSAFLLVQALVPRKTLNELYKIFGLMTCMDEFKGNGSKSKKET